MKFKILGLATLILLLTACKENAITEFPENLRFELGIKTAGNPSSIHKLVAEPSSGGYLLKSSENLSVDISARIDEISTGRKRISVTIRAVEEVNLNLRGHLLIPEINYDRSSFLLPGFWYRKNLRSPQGAPSIRRGEDWMVREDRMSVPLAGVYDPEGGLSISVCRIDKIKEDALIPYKKGEVIIHGLTDVGSTGFGKEIDHARLSFGYPYAEEPYTYIRKLTLDPATMGFLHMEAGTERELTWEIRKTNSESYSAFVKDTWNYAYDLFKPALMEGVRSDEEVKSLLTRFYTQSYTDTNELAGFSGVHLNIKACENRELLEVGFVGRVLLNAYNALEYGYEHEDVELLGMAHQIYDSYTAHGFTDRGFIREVVDFQTQQETEIYSIRRQSEGLLAILQFLRLEAEHNRTHRELSEKTRQLLDNLVALQQNEYFPRKFNDRMEVHDDAGGSTSTAIIPLLMGWKLFKDPVYLESARRAGRYVEKEIIRKGDYFSSTLDANCEDKEASIYASCAMYYLGLVSEKEEAGTYYSLAEQAAYFALSWYYLWDVPFAPGQMLGDLGFKTRGWGNVSVENNHVDVYIFDFADVLRHLSETGGNSRLAEMAAVIKSSMKDQLIPEAGRMCGIGKEGYYPEVVQHTNWDYGQFGKGYYNDLFAPGWVVSSLWELLSEERMHRYFMD